MSHKDTSVKSILFALLVISLRANTQVIQETDTSVSAGKAKYLKGDIKVLLSGKINYPEEALKNNIEGDVIISFGIDRNGRQGDPVIISSPHFSLSTSTIVALDYLDNEWSPAREKNVPVDKIYLIIFRYRIYLNSKPTDYIGQVKRLIEKQKYDKALKMCIQAIEENEYSSELFELKSNVKELMGDAEGAKKDHLMSLKLNEEIMTIINVNAIGFTRVEQRLVGVEVRKLN